MRVWIAQHVADYGYGEGYAEHIGVFASQATGIKFVEEVWWPESSHVKYYTLPAARIASYNAEAREWEFSLDHTITLWPEEVLQ